MVVSVLFVMLRVGLWSVIVAFPGYTRLLSGELGNKNLFEMSWCICLHIK